MFGTPIPAEMFLEFVITIAAIVCFCLWLYALIRAIIKSSCKALRKAKAKRPTLVLKSHLAGSQREWENAKPHLVYRRGKWRLSQCQRVPQDVLSEGYPAYPPKFRVIYPILRKQWP